MMLMSSSSAVMLYTTCSAFSDKIRRMLDFLSVVEGANVPSRNSSPVVRLDDVDVAPSWCEWLPVA